MQQQKEHSFHHQIIKSNIEVELINMSDNENGFSRITLD